MEFSNIDQDAGRGRTFPVKRKKILLINVVHVVN